MNRFVLALGVPAALAACSASQSPPADPSLSKDMALAQTVSAPPRLDSVSSLVV